MQLPYISKIIHNINHLSSNTVNTDVLMGLLLGRRVLLLTEFQKLVKRIDADPYRGHTEMYIELTKKEDDAFHILLECLTEIGNDHLKTTLITYEWHTREVQININPEKLYFEVPLSTRHFVGRVSLLNEIHQYWKSNFQEKTLPLLVVTGESGIGKTELASKYVELFCTDVNGHCLWINAESGETTISSFRDLATEMSIPTFGGNLQESEIKAICNHFKSEECIFVFDRVSNYHEENFQRFLTRCRTTAHPNTIKPFIFLTSVNGNTVQQVFKFQANHVRLTKLDHSENVEYFKTVFSCEDHVELIDKLTQAINGHPRNMVNVAAHISDNYCDCLLADVIERTLRDIQGGTFILLA